MPIIGARGSLSSGGFGEFRRAAGFPTYWVVTRGTPGGQNNTKVNKSSSISTLAADSNTGATTISSYSFSTTRRFGTILATGNVIFTDVSLSTNGGASFSDIFNVNVIQSTPFSSGQNGSFAYNPTAKRISVAFTFPDKSGNFWGATTYNTETGDYVNSSSGPFSFGSNIVVNQIVYVPNMSSVIMLGASASSSTTASYQLFIPPSQSAGNNGSTSQFGVTFIKAGISASGNLIGFTPFEMREFTSTTPGDFSTYIYWGIVTGTQGISNAYRYLGFKYLPVNNQYAMLGWATSSPTQLYFYKSSLGSPASFTGTAITLTLEQSVNTIFTGSIFEDTNGYIYLSIFVQYASTAETNSFTFLSINGGASFSMTNTTVSTQGPAVITRNLL